MVSQRVPGSEPGALRRDPPASSNASRGSAQPPPASLSVFEDTSSISSSSAVVGGLGGGASGGDELAIPPKRTLANVLKRISALEANQSRQHWMPDSNCKECYECGQQFSTFRRRHHCRVCGQIFCWRCCRQFVSGKVLDRPGELRCCNFCAKVIASSDQWEKTALPQPADWEAQEDSAEMILESPPQRTMLSSRQLAKQPVFLQKSQETVNIPAVLHMLRQAVGEGSLEIGDHRQRLVNYPDSFVANEFVDWLLGAGIIKKRSQGVVIGQALLDSKLV